MSVYFSINAGQTGSGMAGYGGYSGAMYLTDVAPTGWMSTPWAEVLGLSCKWADGKSGKGDCLQFCTKGLYHSDMFHYSNALTYHIDQSLDGYNQPTGNYGKFKLSSMLSGYQIGGSYGNGDCRDTSSFLSLATSSLGYAGALTQGYSPGTDGNGNTIEQEFQTNYIQAIGRPGYVRAYWDFHQFLEDSTGVFDACAAQAVNLSGSAYNEVPFAWPRAGFWQTVSGSDYYGLVRGLTSANLPNTVSPTFLGALVQGPLNPFSFQDRSILQGVE